MTEHPIVVGADISAGAIDALRWALAETATPGQEIVLLHTIDSVDAELVGSAQLEQDPTLVGRMLLELYRTIGMRIAPDAVVRTRLVEGDPAGALIAASREARLIALGPCDREGMARSALGSVASRVAVHSQCPVVIASRRPGRTATGRVVVGLSDEPAGRRAIDLAAATANRAGKTLVLVRSTPSSDLDREAAIAHVTAQVTDLSTRYPQLQYVTAITSQDAAPALMEAARDADLVVVGCHHSADPFNARLGSVPAALVGRIDCPIALVGRER